MTPEELKKLAAYLRKLAEKLADEADDHFVAGALEGLAEELEMRAGVK